MDINVTGTFLCMKYQILAMIERRTKGSIVNTASVAGVVGVPMHGEYVGAKHAVVGLTRVAAADYGKHGIRVNALVPGEIGRAQSELQSLMRISYAVFCLKKTTHKTTKH